MIQDMTGRTFGRWTVLRYDSNPTGWNHYWLCRCQCGTEGVIHGGSLQSGTSRSCGCLKREASAARCKTHGWTGTPTYKAWKAMWRRCTPGNPNGRYYADRGITVCDRWRHSFEDFLADMGPKPDGTSLDRIDNDGNYEPGNCRWATKAEQSSNTRRNIYVDYEGERITLKAWATRMGIPYGRLTARIHYGWTMEQVLNTPRLDPVPPPLMLEYRGTNRARRLDDA